MTHFGVGGNDQRSVVGSPPVEPTAARPTGDLRQPCFHPRPTMP